MPKWIVRLVELARMVARRFEEDKGLQIASSLSLTWWLVSASAGWTQDIPHADGVLIKLPAVALTALALALLYYAMPYRSVKIADALTGGVLAGVVFEVTKHGFGFYVTSFPTYKLVYGALPQFRCSCCGWWRCSARWWWPRCPNGASKPRMKPLRLAVSRLSVAELFESASMAQDPQRLSR